jgi:hypothetical protein
MRSAFVLAVAGSLVAAAATAQQTATYKPVANAAQLMKSIIIPTSDAVFGVSAKPPKTDADWTVLQDAALTLAESGNLLIMRAPSANRANWIKFSRALVDGGASAFKAAAAKNAEGVLNAGDVIYTACDDCHKQYMKQ